MANDQPADEKEEKAKKAREKRADFHAKLDATAELLFVVLPFIVIAITLAHRGELRTIFYLPEWSIVSAVIMGQTIRTLVSLVLGEKVYKAPILLALTILIVFGLVPILVILSIVLIADKVSTALAAVQGTMFCISAFLFWLIYWAHRSVEKEKR